MCELPKAIQTRLVRARLPHRCYSCGLPIMTDRLGEAYVLVTGVWNGRGETYRRHELCDVLENQLSSGDDCGVELGALVSADDYVHPGGVFTRAWEAVMCRPWPRRHDDADEEDGS